MLLFGCTENRQLNLIQASDERLGRTEYREAEELLRKAVSLNPESKTAIKAIYKLGFVQETYLKQYDAALFNYQEYIRLSQDPVGLYEVQKRIANLYFEQRFEPEKAITAYRKLISLNPESLEVDSFQFRIAQIYYRQDKFDQSRLELQQLVEKFPKSHFVARARYDIGNAYYMEGKYDIAIEALKQVVRNHPQTEWSTEAEFLMASCLEHQDKLSEALPAFEALKGRYSSPDVLNLRISEIKKRIKLGPTHGH